MRPRFTLLTILAVLLAMLGATAAFAESSQQNVDVNVMPLDALYIEVDDVGFGMVEGQTQANHFRMMIMNTTSGGWQVTADGDDLVSYEWRDPCDQNGCTRYPTFEATIPASNIKVTGGHLDWWDQQQIDEGIPDVLVAYDGTLDNSPVLIQTGTEYAWGGFELDNPHPVIEVTVPGGTPALSYFTTVTYTITSTP
jgi:hypothetical protein